MTFASPKQSIHIAVLESDRKRSEAIRRALAGGGFSCETFGSGRKLLESLQAVRFDLLVLGSGRNGSAEIVRQLRSATQPEAPVLPILLLAANGDADRIALAMASGASDYLCLPLRAAELKTRVSVLLALSYPERMASERQPFGPFVFDSFAHQVTRDSTPIKLARREFDLALLLFRNLGRPLSRVTIAETVWGRDGDVASRTIDTHVSRVRGKLQLRPEHGYRLTQVYGYGYRLEQLDFPGS